MNGVSVAPTPKDCLRKSAQCSITIDPGQGQSEYYLYSRTKGAYRQGNSLVLFVATRTSSLFHKRLRAHHGFCENLLPYNHDSYEPIKSQIYICCNTWIVEVCAKFWTDGIIISPITATGFFKTWITSSFGLCEMGHNDVLESKVIHADKVTSATTCSTDMLNLHAGICMLLTTALDVLSFSIPLAFCSGNVAASQPFCAVTGFNTFWPPERRLFHVPTRTTSSEANFREIAVLFLSSFVARSMVAPTTDL